MEEDDKDMVVEVEKPTEMIVEEVDDSELDRLFNDGRRQIFDLVNEIANIVTE